VPVLNRNEVARPDSVWQDAPISLALREHVNRHSAAVVWFTGFSGAGKTTLANAVNHVLFQASCNTIVLDGDTVRKGLCSDLDFSVAARHENMRRMGHVARMFFDSGSIVLASFISPLRQDRDMIRALLPQGRFFEIHCQATLAACEARDVKGLYKRARAGMIAEFTGISAPYEVPHHPELSVDTAHQSVEHCVMQVIELLTGQHIIR